MAIKHNGDQLQEYAQTADLTDLALHGDSCGMKLSIWLLHVHSPQCC